MHRPSRIIDLPREFNAAAADPTNPPGGRRPGEARRVHGCLIETLFSSRRRVIYVAISATYVYRP